MWPKSISLYFKRRCGFLFDRITKLLCFNRKNTSNVRLWLTRSTIILLVLVIVAVIRSYTTDVPPNSDPSNNRQHTLLLWTTYHYSRKWIGLNYESLGCKFKNCNFTYDRSTLNKSSAVLFFGNNVRPDDMPHVHSQSQPWVLFASESPRNMRGFRRRLALVQSQINLFMSYRLDADLYSGHGFVKKRDQILENYKVDYDSKKKDVLWIVSNCKTNGRREDFVRELAKYIQVDVYGGCGPFKCRPWKSKKCLQKLGKMYKFYLSFENSICPDYISEKAYDPLEFDMIPVVFGGANYDNALPKGSFINALKFKSPKDLARELLRIGNQSSLYESYFEWKKEYWAERTRFLGFCTLCEKLNNPSSSYVSNIRDFVKWYFDDAKCYKWDSSTNVVLQYT